MVYDFFMSLYDVLFMIWVWEKAGRFSDGFMMFHDFRSYEGTISQTRILHDAIDRMSE